MKMPLQRGRPNDIDYRMRLAEEMIQYQVDASIDTTTTFNYLKCVTPSYSCRSMPFGSGWQVWALDGIWSFVIGLDLWKVVEPLSEFQEFGVFLDVLRPNSLEIVDSLGDFEVGDSQIPEQPVIFAKECVDPIDLGLDFLSEDLLLVLIKLVAEAQLDSRGKHIIENAQDIINHSLILDGLPEEFRLPNSGNIPDDG